MSLRTLLIVLLLFILLGGGGFALGAPASGIGVVGFVVLVIVILLLTGNLRD